MSEVDVAQLRKLINEAIDQWVAGGSASTPDVSPSNEITEVVDKPKDKRVVRTKSTGDRVYLVDEVAKTKAWVTSAEILEKLGFTMADVEEVEDKDMLGYQMTASIYRVG